MVEIIDQNGRTTAPAEERVYYLLERGSIIVLKTTSFQVFSEACNDGHVPASPEDVERYTAIQEIKDQVNGTHTEIQEYVTPQDSEEVTEFTRHMQGTLEGIREEPIAVMRDIHQKSMEVIYQAPPRQKPLGRPHPSWGRR